MKRHCFQGDLMFFHTFAQRLGQCGYAAALLLFGVFAITAVPGWPGPALAQEAPAQQSKDESLASIWTARAGDIDALVQEATTLHAYAEELSRPLADELRAARAEFTRLSSLYQASRGHPTEQLTLVQQMHTLQQKLKKRLAPIEEIAGTINGRLEEIDTLQTDLAASTRDGSADGDGQSSTVEEGLNKYRRSLADARRTLTPAAARLQSILAPTKTTVARIDQSVANIEGSLVTVWENYYITPSDTNLDALASTPSLLADWVGSLNSRVAFAYPQSVDEWFNALKIFLGAALIMGILGYLGVQGARMLPGRWHNSLERAIRRSWGWVGFGLSMLMASDNRYGGIYFGFVLVGSLIIIAGVAALTWRLRIAVIPILEDKPSPMNRLYPPAAIGVLMLFSDLPTRILGIMWGLVMVIFIAMIFSLNRQHKTEGTLPLLERLSYGCAFWFGIGSLLVTLGGYARLAILMFMLLFALVNTVTLSSALMGLVDILAEKIFSKKEKPVRNALAEAAGIPLAWLLSLLCTFPWFWAVPGAKYVAAHVLSANYTLGDASFDFSRVLIIVLLFFLFRSFISLGRTSLEHLPDRLPSMERGVIPPLRTLITYALWTLFIIIALGLVGVNFTSLAVVAGGLSVGIGFGMQNIFNNLVSGLMLIFGRTILVGDYVDVSGASGTVRAINIRSTVIETPERALVYVPNSAIMSGQVTNWTRNSRIVRRSLSIGVAYGSDTTLVTKLLLDAAKEQKNILQMPAPVVYLNNFGDSSLEFTMNVFIDDFDNSVSAMSNLRMIVERLFSENSIDIPYPQMTLHMPATAGIGPAEVAPTEDRTVQPAREATGGNKGETQ